MSNTLSKPARALLAMQRHSWEQGVAMQAFHDMGDTKTLINLAFEAAHRALPDGRVAMLDGETAAVDPCAGGGALLAAARLTNDPELVSAHEKLTVWALKTAPRNHDGLVYHFADGSHQLWADSMYMLPPFLAASGYCDEAVKQFDGYWDILFDPAASLVHHMWDDDSHRFTRAAYWGTGNGWALAAIVRLLDSLPREDPARTGLEHKAHLVLEGLMRHLRPDGLFHDVVDEPSSFVETNLSQMCACSVYRGVGQGWLEESWLEVADTMRAAAERAVDGYGFVHDVCGAPAFDKPGFSPEAQAFHIMMEVAYLDL